MVLGAVTAGTRRETVWVTRDMGRLFPEQWQEFIAPVPDPGEDLTRAYAKLLADPSRAVREDAARRWCDWEDTHVSLMPGWAPHPRYEDAAFRMVFARLVTHYWSNGCFLGDDQLFDHVDRLADIPAVLIHGRYDVSGPLDTAWDLHRAWPASRLVVLEDAGHGGDTMTSAMVEALDGLP